MTKGNKMRAKNLVVFFSILAVIVILVNISVTFIKISEFKKEFTGKVFGYVNITVSSAVVLNVSRDVLNWSSGLINSGEANATLYTRGENTGYVERGNWSGVNAKAFVVENIGNINCSLFIKSGKDAHELFESASNSNEQYMLNVTNKDSQSCSGGATLGQWLDANKTSGGTKYCSQFSPISNSNEIYIDVLLTVPRDSNKVGELLDTLTIIGNSAG